MSAYVPLIAVAAGLIGLGVALVMLAHLPALWTTTGPVPEPVDDAGWGELADDLAAAPDLDAALAHHGLTDGAR